MYTCMYIHIYIYIHTCVHMYTYIYICMHTYRDLPFGREKRSPAEFDPRDNTN